MSSLLRASSSKTLLSVCFLWSPQLPLTQSRDELLNTTKSSAVSSIQIGSRLNEVVLVVLETLNFGARPARRDERLFGTSGSSSKFFSYTIHKESGRAAACLTFSLSSLNWFLFRRKIKISSVLIQSPNSSVYHGRRIRNQCKGCLCRSAIF